jgi:hypothetical protein
MSDKRGRGRPEIGPPFLVRLRVDQLEAIDERAKAASDAEGRTVRRAEMVRRLIDAGLEVTQ